MHSEKKHIIVIEDNEADASVTHEALTTWSLDCEVKRFRDGAEAMPILREKPFKSDSLIGDTSNHPPSYAKIASTRRSALGHVRGCSSTPLHDRIFAELRNCGMQISATRRP